MKCTTVDPEKSSYPVRRQARLCRVVLAMLCLWVTPVHAQPAEAEGYYEEEINTDCTDLFPESQEQPPADFLSFLDVPQATVSTGLESMVRYVDEFFANEKVLYESSGSYVRYTIDNLLEEGGRTTTVGDLNIGIRLRRTEEKLKLVIESQPLEKQDTINIVTKNPTPDVEKDKNLYAGVQREFGDEDRWRLKPSVGLKLHFPIEYYVRLRAYRDIYLESWIVHLVESIYWFDTTGSGFDSSMEWDYLLAKDLLFRSGSLVRYTEENEYIDGSQVFYLIQTLNKRAAITYSAGVFGNDEPSVHATDYIVSARFRQNVHKDYLFFEVQPQIRHRIDYEFKQELSLTLRLEWLFTR